MAKMKNLSRNELTQYISIVCQMEQNRYQQNKAIEQVKNQIRILSNPYRPAIPAVPKNLSRKGGGVIFTILGVFMAYSALTTLLYGGVSVYGIILGGCSVVSLMKVAEIRNQNKGIEEKNRTAQKGYHHSSALNLRHRLKDCLQKGGRYEGKEIKQEKQQRFLCGDLSFGSYLLRCDRGSFGSNAIIKFCHCVVKFGNSAKKR